MSNKQVVPVHAFCRAQYCHSVMANPHTVTTALRIMVSLQTGKYAEAGNSGILYPCIAFCCATDLMHTEEFLLLCYLSSDKLMTYFYAIQ